jgi:hypothetical protein
LIVRVWGYLTIVNWRKWVTRLSVEQDSIFVLEIVLLPFEQFRKDATQAPNVNFFVIGVIDQNYFWRPIPPAD